jgi:hypothetical protein
MAREIEIPVKRAGRRSKSSLIRSAMKAESKALIPDTSGYEFRCDLNDTVYFPYIIGRVRTSKTRVILPPKIINFFVVCNAVDGKYLVTRAMPKTKKIEVEEENLIEDYITEKYLKEKIIPESIRKHINRQFIFGDATTADYMECRLVYIPAREVEIRRKGKEKFESHFINQYTGHLEGE